MGVRHFSDLVAWQLADDLRQFIFDRTAAGPVSDDWRFRDQLRDAANGVARNIAEGFGRYHHRDFARFLTIARSSLDETEDALIAGHRRHYFDDETLADAVRRIKRTNGAIMGLLRYLRSTKEPRPFRTRRT